MKRLVAPLAIAASMTGTMAATETPSLPRAVPGLEHYDTTVVQGDLWQRDDLSARDRSVVTVAVLIARGQGSVLSTEFSRALDNGVTPAELSEIVTHLAFYTGWGNGAAAAEVLAPLYEARGIATDSLPGADVTALPLDMTVESAREDSVQATHGQTAAGVVDYTRDVLFRDLWLRPGLAPRDRSLITVTALVAAGQAEQVPFHLGRAMDNGLTQAEAAGVLTHLAFYAGWPRVFSAMPVFRDVFDARTEAE